MSHWAAFMTKVRETLRRGDVDRELDEEIAYHIEHETERLIAGGIGPEAARRQARAQFGNARAVREQVREEYGFAGLEAVWRDLRHATRGLRRSPGFAATAIVTIGLGIGATTAVFSVLNGVVLRPLPYDDAGEIVRVSHTDNDGDRLGIPDGAYFFWRDNATTLDAVAAYLELSEPLHGAGEPLELGMIIATPSLFEVVRVAPLYGRLFTEEDAAPGAPDVVLLTYSFWQDRYGGDPGVIGRDAFPESDMEVIGVLPPDFDFVRPDPTISFGSPFDEPQIVMPLTMRQANARYGNFMYQGIARLAPGATPEAAATELMSFMPRAAETYTGSHTPQSLREGGHRPVVVPLKRAIVGSLEDTLWILLGAVGFVLLIAVANVANLFVARAGARGREIAVRRSLGAGWGALARASVSEGVVLSLAGGALGVGLAVVGTRALLGLAPADIPRVEQIGIDPVVLAFAAGVSVLAGLVFGLLPLVQFRGAADGGAALREESRGGTAGRDRQRMRRGLVAVQVAFALVLLVGAGLLLRTFANLRAIEPGFDPAGVLTMRVTLPESRTETAASEAVSRAREMVALVERIETIPGVEMAAFTADLPLDGGEYRDYVAVEGALPAVAEGERAALEEAPTALRVFSGPGYLTAIGARFVAGRDLERGDFADYPQYVVVNEAFAAERWPGESALGRRLVQWPNDPEQDVWYTVAGVVADIREASLMTPPEPTIYLPTVFRPDDGFGMWITDMTLVVRMSAGPAAADPASVFGAIEREIHAYHPEIPIRAVQTLGAVEARSFQQVSFAMVLILVAGGVALLLGAIGIYGVVSYLVTLRTRELGIRIALGASPRTLRRSIVREGAGIAALGIGVGVVAAFLVSRVLSSMLFGVATTDLVTYGGVCTVLFVAVILASLGPARRATGVDPVEAIRAE